jgi:hypothetical protein
MGTYGHMRNAMEFKTENLKRKDHLVQVDVEGLSVN